MFYAIVLDLCGARRRTVAPGNTHQPLHGSSQLGKSLPFRGSMATKPHRHVPTNAMIHHKFAPRQRASCPYLVKPRPRNNGMTHHGSETANLTSFAVLQFDSNITCSTGTTQPKSATPMNCAPHLRHHPPSRTNRAISTSQLHRLERGGDHWCTIILHSDNVALHHEFVTWPRTLPTSAEQQWKIDGQADQCADPPGRIKRTTTCTTTVN